MKDSWIDPGTRVGLVQKWFDNANDDDGDADDDDDADADDQLAYSNQVGICYHDYGGNMTHHV